MTQGYFKGPLVIFFIFYIFLSPLGGFGWVPELGTDLCQWDSGWSRGHCGSADGERDVED